MKKAVILGAGGFIGTNLARQLCLDNWEVICFDRHDRAAWPSQVQRIIGDFSAPPGELIDAMKNAHIFHLISSCRPSSTTVQLTRQVHVDLVGTIQCLEATRHADNKWVFISSGGTVYGESKTDTITETHSTEPLCPYGVIKLSIENYFQLYGRLHQTPFVILRLANPYGPWQDISKGQGLITTLLQKAMRQESIEIWGDGNNVRDYIYIDDAVAGIVQAALAGRSGETYNIGTGAGTSITALITEIANNLNVQIPIRYSASRGIDVKRNVLNVSKIYLDTQWKANTSLQSGINMTASWIRQSENHTI
jgi:UDP-glucose 4-epimerase